MAASPADFVEVAKSYARKAIRDKKGKRHGLLIRQAAQRFLDDLKRSRRKTCPFLFDRWHANDVCEFIETLPHVEGEWDTPNIVLHESHVFFLVQLFGFRQRKVEKSASWGNYRPRRYTSALFAVARKNAKSTLAAGIMLYCMCCEPGNGAQLISAATTYDQASIIFKTAKAMASREHDLREEFDLECWAKAMTREPTGATMKALHAKASTQDGLNPSHVALDEIHAHKTPDLLNVLRSAAGARKGPLWLYTTTEGYTNPGPWAEIRKFAKDILAGTLGETADHFLVVFYAVDDGNKSLKITADDDFNEEAWHKANPLLEVNPVLLDAIRKDAIEAKHMPSNMAEFRIKRLNRQASTAEGLIDLPKWQKCNGVVDLEALREYPCYGGMDLASTRDIAAFRLVWRVEGVFYTIGWRWVPSAAVAQRTIRGTDLYSGWVESGALLQTEGDVTDYSVIKEKILWAAENFDLQEIAYDSWQAADLVNQLTEEDIELVEFIQGPKSYHPAMQAVERAYISGNLAHGGDPVLEWMASNLVPRYGENLNMAPDKKKSADKIDDMCALFMAAGILVAAEGESDDLEQFMMDPIVA